MSPTRDQVLGHADEADGIEEYDNPLPDWWLGLFIGCCIWALGYTVYYHVVAEKSQPKTLAAEMAAAEARWPKLELNAAALDLSEATVEEGESLYKTNCAACHGAEMQGGIGPNLKDSVWIHGGTNAAILTTITEGVAAKGMPAWGPMIGPEKVAKVAAYVITHSGGHDDADESAEDRRPEGT